MPRLNVESVADFQFFYWRSRNWSSLLAGLPALFCMLAGVAALAAVRRPHDSDLVRRYETGASNSRNDEHVDAEDLCRRRILELRPKDRKAMYDYAAMLDRRDETSRAAGIMLSLAPLTDAGYAPSQFWLAERMMKAPAPLSPANSDLLERRLELSLKGLDAVPAARIALADLAVKTRKWTVAVEQLEAVSAQRPDLLMTLANVYRELNNTPKANSTADRSASHYANRVRANPQDDDSRLQWVKALVFQRNLRRAMEVLQSANGAETDPRYTSAMAQLFVLRMAETKTNAQESGPADALKPANLPATALEVASRIELLAQAVHYAPNHPGVLTALAQLSTEETPEGAQARSWLKESLARGRGTATVHLILGTAAATKGDLTEAAFHLEQARQRDPSQGEAANNLAYVLARSDPPRTEEALQLLDAALKATPNHPRIRETRGQILLMNGRAQEAILELEYVVEKIPNHIQAHAGLATAYESLGDQDLANRHRRIAEELKAKERKPAKATKSQ